MIEHIQLTAPLQSWEVDMDSEWHEIIRRIHGGDIQIFPTF